MDDCDICLKKLRNSNKFQLACGHHNFHRDCIFEWLQISPACPLCKGAVGCDIVDEVTRVVAQRQGRASRRRSMAAGLGKVSQFDEDLMLAAEMSILDSMK